jgi:hypothetical protein
MHNRNMALRLMALDRYHANPDVTLDLDTQAATSTLEFGEIVLKSDHLPRGEIVLICRYRAEVRFVCSIRDAYSGPKIRVGLSDESSEWRAAVNELFEECAALNRHTRIDAEPARDRSGKTVMTHETITSMPDAERLISRWIAAPLLCHLCIVGPFYPMRFRHIVEDCGKRVREVYLHSARTAGDLNRLLSSLDSKQDEIMMLFSVGDLLKMNSHELDESLRLLARLADRRKVVLFGWPLEFDALRSHPDLWARLIFGRA